MPVQASGPVKLHVLWQNLKEAGNSGALEQESESLRDLDGWLCHPRAPAGLGEKVCDITAGSRGRDWIPGLLSEFGNSDKLC